MIAIYDKTGRITQVMTMYPEKYLEGLAAQNMQGVQVPKKLVPLGSKNLILGYYVKDGELAERPENPLPSVVDLKVGETFEAPEMVACTVVFDDQTFEVPAGEFSFTGEAPGEYAVYVKCFPMQNKQVIMVVT